MTAPIRSRRERAIAFAQASAPDERLRELRRQLVSGPGITDAIALDVALVVLARRHPAAFTAVRSQLERFVEREEGDR